MLKWLVRDEGKLTLEEAHFRLSALAAHAAGFRDRGVLREGAAADVVVYDMEELDMEPALDRRGRPRPARRRVAPGAAGQGYKEIIVNGETTFSDGECTGATPGTPPPPRPRLTHAGGTTTTTKECLAHCTITMLVAGSVGILVSILDAADDDVSVWNVIAIGCFLVVLFYGFRGLSERTS